MRALAEQIMKSVGALPEGSSITTGSLLHLGGRAAVHRALSRLARRTPVRPLLSSMAPVTIQPV